VVIGELHRAFCGNRFSLTFPVFVHYVIALWVPEVEGPMDPGSEAHDLVMSIFGGMSKGERMRIQHRVRSAMAAQAAGQGRFPGGRPPYRYRMADAGPHPTRARPPTGSGSAASNGTLPRRPSCNGSSPSSSPGPACTSSPGAFTHTVGQSPQQVAWIVR
jgi:hypothetical protein